MRKITSKVDREDMDNARIDRNRASNPVDVEPGMDDFNWDEEDTSLDSPSSGGWGSNMGGDSGFGSGGFGSGGFGSGGGGFGSTGSGGFGGGGPFGNSPFGNSPFGSSPFGQQPEPKKDDDEEKFWQTLSKIGKGFLTFSGDFVRSFQTFDVTKRLSFGKASLVTGVITGIIGFVLILFGFGSQLGYDLLVGGLLAVGVGVPTFMFAYDNISKNGVPEQTFSEPETSFPQGFGNNEDSFDSGEDDEFDMFGDDDEDEEDEDFLLDDSDDDIDFSAFNEETSEEVLETNRNTVLENINVNSGMVTRQYLYENISASLMNVNQKFDTVKNISESSDEFDAWDAIVQNSAKVFAPKNTEDMPYLLTAKEKIFYVLLEVKRVNWLKNINAFVDEIVNICRFDEETGTEDTNIYGIGHTVGDKIYIKIMKGETALVTIKDTFKSVEKEIINTKNYMPIILGLDAEGNVVWRDFKDINSILVTGMPRSGKTWHVQSVLTQMMFYLKPSELHFYILDPKDQISDFKSMRIPHIRKFVSDDDDILRELRHIVKVEGPRRKKIIGEAGFVNIWDYKKRNPDAEMPLLYVVIDEVITLAERMDRDTKDEFQALLLELVSQLPALGIRIFMIPHVVKDQILKKSITDLIPCRISVRGDADHIEKSVGVKNFKHKLIHQGDMAVRFNNDDPIFVHSAVLTNSNEGNSDLFDFLYKFWTKIEPESVKGSLHEKLEKEQEIRSQGSSGVSNIKVQTETPKKKLSVRPERKVLSTDDINDLVKGLHDVED